jgi:hypothetical protein
LKRLIDQTGNRRRIAGREEELRKTWRRCRLQEESGRREDELIQYAGLPCEELLNKKIENSNEDSTTEKEAEK